MGKDVAVLDIGSRKLVFAVGRRALNGVTSILSFSDYLYDGYFDGEFCNKDMLLEDVKKVIFSKPIHKMPKCLYIGVPAEFTKIQSNIYQMYFGKEKLISNSLINKLHEKGDEYAADYDYDIISSAALEYDIDNRKYYSNPVGERGRSIRAAISYILAKKSFIALFDKIASTLGFKETKYISSQYALGSRFIDNSARAYGSISLDVGFGSTSLAILLGEGIAKQETTPYGSATIYSMLANALNIDFVEALRMENTINLNFEAADSAVYMVNVEKGTKTYKAADVNNAVLRHLDELVEFVDQTINSASSLVSDTTPIYLTGGGICGIKGAIMYLEQKLKRRIRVCALEIPNYNKPYYTSVFSLLDVAHEINENSSIWNKLF